MSGLDAAISTLRSADVSSIEPGRMPRNVFSATHAVLRAAKNAGALERQRLVNQLGERASIILLAFARDCAVVALRDNRGDLIEDGIRALALEDLRFDARDTMRSLGLLEHSAKRLNADFVAAVSSERRLMSNDFSMAVDGYLHRPEAGRTLETWGFNEVSTSEGPSYAEKPLR